MLIRRRLAALLAAMIAALAIAVPVASASAPRVPGPGWSPGPILPPNAQCPIWVGLNIIPEGCVPWWIIINDRLHGLPF